MAPFEGFRNALRALKPTTKAKARNALLEAELEALQMMADQLHDDITDAVMFYDKLAVFRTQETALKNRFNITIGRAKEALKVFEQHKKEGFEEGAKSIELYRTRTQLLRLSLQSVQSSLMRRIDWMRDTYTELAKSGVY